MADLTITVSNTLTILGEDAPQLWNKIVWGTNNWGIQDDFLAVDATHLVEDSLGSDSSNFFSVTHLIEDSLPSDSSVSLAVDRPRTVSMGSISPSSDIVTIVLTDGSGYKYVFVRPTTNSDLRNNSVYTAGTSPGSTYSAVARPSDTWS